MKRTASICLAISLALMAAAKPAEARLRPRYGGTLRVEARAAAADSALLASLTSETLTGLDDSGKLRPWLADKWESQNGDRRWLFTLHPRVTFADGTPLTGTAVADTLTANRSVVPWKSVRGTDATVTFESDSPMPALPATLASPAFAIARRSSEGWPVGTGPYRVASVVGANATLEANDNYWRGRAYADHVEIYGNRSTRNQWLDLGVDRADIVEVPGESLRRAQQEHLRVSSLGPAELVLIEVSPEVTDIRLRQAISLSIDRASLAGVVFQKQGQPATTLLPDAMTGYSVLFGSGFDPSGARALRAQIASAPPMTISYDAGDPALQLAAERIALNAREAGFALQAVPQTASGAASLRLVRLRLPSSDPAACLAEVSRSLLGQAIAPPQGIEALYAQESQMLGSYWLIPIAHLPVAAAVSERVRDLEMHWNGADLKNAWIEERR